MKGGGGGWLWGNGWNRTITEQKVQCAGHLFSAQLHYFVGNKNGWFIVSWLLKAYKLFLPPSSWKCKLIFSFSFESDQINLSWFWGTGVRSYTKTNIINKLATVKTLSACRSATFSWAVNWFWSKLQSCYYFNFLKCAKFWPFPTFFLIICFWAMQWGGEGVYRALTGLGP